MIVDRLVETLLGILNGVLGLFPAWSLSLNLAGVGSALGAGAHSAQAFFPPITTLAMCIAVIIGLKAALFLWNFMVWLYRLIPAKFT